MFGFLFKNKKKSAVNLEELTQELQDETDKINDEKELIDRYSTQLAIYKRGIELAKEKKNIDVYIYSFSLEKLIKIPV